MILFKLEFVIFHKRRYIMIRHVVMWKLKCEAEGASKQENMEKMRDDLYALRPIIPEILKMEIGFDVKHTDASMDVMLLTEFEDMSSLATYANHPEHLKVAAFIGKIAASRIVLDCEI